MDKNSRVDLCQSFVNRTVGETPCLANNASVSGSQIDVSPWVSLQGVTVSADRGRVRPERPRTLYL